MPARSARKKRRSYKRRSKKQEKRLQTVKKAATLSLVFVLSAGFLSGYIFYKNLTQEFASAFSPSSYNILTEDIFSSVLVVVEDLDQEPMKATQVTLNIFDKSTLKLIQYEIPVSLVIDVPGRFGEEPFSNIIALGNLEGADLAYSANLVSKSVFKLLAFPVDRYMLVDGRGESAAKSLFNGDLRVSEEHLSVEFVKESIRTNFTFRELFNTYTFANSLPKDRIISKELTESYIENPSVLDEELKDLTFDSTLSREKKSISVLNGTNTPGAASFGARVVNNAGGRVVAVGNTRSAYHESVIVVDDMTSESTRIVSNLFGIDEIVLDSDAREFDEGEISRSDITVIFGLDFAESL